MKTKVLLKKGEGRTINAGGLWIYDNEIKEIHGHFKNGDIVDVYAHNEYPLGRGYINQNSKIRIRLMTRNINQEIDSDFLRMRLQNAWDYRKKTVDTSSCRLVFGDADFLPELEAQGELFDMVILDPPAFTKSRASIKNAIKGYREINMRGMKLVKDGGYLATCSCSHFMDYDTFTKTIGQAAKLVHKRLRQVEFRTQAADHPILWNGDENSYYLKFYIFQVVDEK